MTDLGREAEEYGMLQFSNREISTILEISVDVLTEKYLNDINRGRLKAEAEVRKSIVDSAKTGNTAAQKQFMELNRKVRRGK